MNEGDLVLTPSMAWHDHVHRGSAPMIWIDVLDISLSRALHATFFEPYDDGDMQPVDAVPERSYRAFGSGVMRSPRTTYQPGVNPLLAYPRQQAEDALEMAGGLEADPFDDVILEYQNPVEGGPAMKTLGMKLQKLRPGFHGQARRHTGSKLFCVLRGYGVTIVDGQRYDWGPGDFIAIKPWAWHEHLNESAEEAVLFLVDDTPALQALGYYREESLSYNGGQQANEDA